MAATCRRRQPSLWGHAYDGQLVRRHSIWTNHSTRLLSIRTHSLTHSEARRPISFPALDRYVRSGGRHLPSISLTSTRAASSMVLYIRSRNIPRSAPQPRQQPSADITGPWQDPLQQIGRHKAVSTKEMRHVIWLRVSTALLLWLSLDDVTFEQKV